MRPTRLTRSPAALASTLFAGVLAAALLGGCFLDEIDKAAEWQAQPKPEPTPVTKNQAPGGMAPKTNWWATAKSLGSEQLKSDIVQCRVGDSTQFMGREDCLARGGVPK